MSVRLREQQERGSFRSLEEGAIGPERRHASQRHAALAQPRDARGHVPVAEHEQRTLAQARTVERQVQVIARERQVRIGRVGLARGDEAERLPERLGGGEVADRQADLGEVTAQRGVLGVSAAGGK